MKLYPIKSIITDNGNKFSSLGEIEGLDVYFAHAYSSYDQGTNENFNGLLRESFQRASMKDRDESLVISPQKKLFELNQTA